MNSNDWAGLFKSVAPLIGTALGGPLGGAAASFLADKLGIEGKTVEAVTDVLNSSKLTPDQLTQVKLAEIEFQKFLKSNKIDLAKLSVEDTKSARDMQTAVRSNIPPILAVLVTTGFFGILAFMLTNEAYKPTEPLLIMLGSLGTAWTGIIGFYFGSSYGSQRKDQLLADSGRE